MKHLRPRMTTSWILSAAVVAGGSTLALLFMHDPLTGEGRVDASASPPEAVALVAFGHVDMERGVVSLYPKAPGQVARLAVSENDTVSEGQVLIQLDDRTARLRLREAAADLAATRQKLAEAEKLPAQHEVKIEQQQAAVNAAKSKLQTARLVLDRQRQLVAEKLVDRLEEQTAAATVQEVEALVQAEEARLRELRMADPHAEAVMARAALDAKQAQLELAQQAVDDCRIVAPSEGSVLRLLVAAGDMLGVPAKQPALLFCPSGARIVRAEVEQEFAARVALGQTAIIHDDASSGRSWHGKVTHVSDWFTQRRSIIQEPLQFNDVRTLECIIALDEGQPALRIGQRVRVKIHERGEPGA